MRNVALREAAITMREINRIERSARISSMKYLGQIHRAAKKKLRSRSFFGQFKTPEKLIKELADMMYAQYLQGVRRTELQANRRGGLKLSSDVQRAIDRVQRLIHLSEFDLDRIRNVVDLRAFEILNDINVRLNGELLPFINDLIASQLNPRDSIKALNDKFDAMGMSVGNSYALENAYRTQSQMAYNSAKYESEQEPAVQEILWGYEYVTVGDSRVRPEHSIMDGVILPKDDPFWQSWYPPNGFSCRCAVVPLFASEPIKRPPPNYPAPDRGFDFSPTLFTTI